MRLMYQATILFCFLCLNVQAQNTPAQKINFKYKAYWGGFVVAEIDSQTLLGSDSYETSATYSVKGIATVIGKMENRTMSRGIYHRTGEYRPQYYESMGNFGKFKYKNEVHFNPDNLMVTEHVQDLELREETEYIPIPNADKHGMDPMTVFLNMIVNKNFEQYYKTTQGRRQFGGIFVSKQSFICDKNKTFDEESRSAFEGDAIGCQIDAQTLAGDIRSTNPDKKPRRGREDDDQDSRLWFGKMDGFDGTVPIYTEFSIGWGKVRIYLSEFNVENIDGPLLTAKNDIN